MVSTLEKNYGETVQPTKMVYFQSTSQKGMTQGARISHVFQATRWPCIAMWEAQGGKANGGAYSPVVFEGFS